jgi:ribonucleoside-triphosphate reductase
MATIQELKSSKRGEGVNFQRIRRITGYLVGTMETWNNAKQAEERDRVTHSVCCNVSNALDM